MGEQQPADTERSFRVVAAPDKFKGSATNAEVAEAIRAGVERVDGATCEPLPMADGGEGTLTIFGGANRSSIVGGPDGHPQHAGWILRDDFAVVEAAECAGLAKIGGAEANDSIAATSRGVGELIGIAIEAGARRVIVGVGGVASTDGGADAVRLLSRFGPFGQPGEVEVVVACDVMARFHEAAVLFGPQKGASPSDIESLEDRLGSLRRTYVREYEIDPSEIPGSGAAGGLAGGLAVLGARLVSGFDLLSEQIGLEDRIRQADLVVTGEGRLDAQSFRGKVVGGVAALARRVGVPAHAIVGASATDEMPAGMLTGASDLSELWGRDAAFGQCLELIADAAEQVTRAQQRIAV